jgi:hypothetical protein
MILSVVVLHAGLAYSNLVPWWPVLDVSRSQFFDIFILIWDTFGIPVLYFIAGYFTLPTLRRRKSVGLFLSSKFKRLGIPFVLSLFLIVPLMPYLGQYTRSENSAISPLEIWIQFVFKATDFKVGYLKPSDIFSHGHLWFVSLLILFFVLFALAYKIKTKLKPDQLESNEINSPPKTKAVILTLIFVGLATALGSILVLRFFSDSSWVNICNILIFQPVRLPLYFGYFLFGIYVYSRNWFVQRDLLGPIIMWLTACIVLSLAFLGAIDAFVKTNPPYNIQMVVTYYMLRSFLCLSFLCLLITFAFRHWNHTSGINQSFSRNSFYIYLIHMPIILILQLFFLNWNISIFVKFTIISALSIILSYAISQYLIKPTPKLSIVLLVSGFILFSVFMAP